MPKCLFYAVLLLFIPKPALAEPIAFNGEGITFIIVATVITGSLAWWRHMRGDRLAAVAVWTVALLAGLMVTRYGADDTLRFFTGLLGA